MLSASNQWRFRQTWGWDGIEGAKGFLFVGMASTVALVKFARSVTLISETSEG
jgi:hypothetical protein